MCVFMHLIYFSYLVWDDHCPTSYVNNVSEKFVLTLSLIIQRDRFKKPR